MYIQKQTKTTHTWLLIRREVTNIQFKIFSSGTILCTGSERIISNINNWCIIPIGFLGMFIKSLYIRKNAKFLAIKREWENVNKIYRGAEKYFGKINQSKEFI